MQFSQKIILRNIIAGLILASFATVIFFSIPFMMHGHGAQMEGGCLFPSGGAAFCLQTDFGSAIHHLTSYQSFLNITANQGMSGLMALVLFLAFAALAVMISLASLPLLKIAGGGRQHNLSPAIPFKEKEISWLSLFENSPSYI